MAGVVRVVVWLSCGAKFWPLGGDRDADTGGAVCSKAVIFMLSTVV